MDSCFSVDGFRSLSLDLFTLFGVLSYVIRHDVLRDAGGKSLQLLLSLNQKLPSRQSLTSPWSLQW